MDFDKESKYLIFLGEGGWERGCWGRGAGKGGGVSEFFFNKEPKSEKRFFLKGGGVVGVGGCK